MRLTKLNRDTLLTFGTNLLVSGLGLTAGIALARALGPKGKGEVFTILLWPQTFAWLGSLGLENANVFSLGRSPESGRKVFANSLSVSLFGGLLIAGLGQFFIATLIRSNDPRVISLARVSLLVAPFLLFSNYLPSILQGSQRTDLFNLLRTANILVWVAPLIVLSLSSALSVQRAVFVWLATIGLTIGFGVSLVTKVTSLGAKPDPNLLKSSLAYGLKTHAGNASAQLNARLDQMLVVALADAQQVGFYSIAAGMSSALWQFSSAFGIALFPFAASRPRQEAAETTARFHSRALALLLLVSALIFLFAPQVIAFLYGRAFTPATLALRILLIGSVAFGLARVLSYGLNGMGFPLYGSLGQVFSLAILAPLLAILIPRFGIVGAAISATVGHLVDLVSLLCFFFRSSRVPASSLLIPEAFGHGFFDAWRALLRRQRTV